ncbi:hypothetical protein BpHYR1_022833 [Brachionus plicatilis]|uniref:Uncharacterized protein n=1 Tax=Brachionus plicatilis TaxID=10195 RepID=A0A3M7QGG9_BRAPC|nr:hypothetical protein BpHYR1_022833 [Brachionus plicatilis]
MEHILFDVVSSSNLNENSQCPNKEIKQSSNAYKMKNSEKILHYAQRIYRIGSNGKLRNATTTL